MTEDKILPLKKARLEDDRNLMVVGDVERNLIVVGDDNRIPMLVGDDDRNPKVC